MESYRSRFNFGISDHNRAFYERRAAISAVKFKNNENNELIDPLKKSSQEIAFKGSFADTKNLYKIADMTCHLDKKLGGHVESCIGNIIEKTGGRFFHYEQNKSCLKISERGMFDLLFESMVYPFTKMPLDLLDFGAAILKKTPLIKNMGIVDSFHDCALLQNHRSKNAIASQVDSITDLFDTIYKRLPASKNFEDLNAEEKTAFQNSLNSIAQTMFSSKTGNYDAVKERSLNRIVSGFIPAFFLANDAYNLSSLINDNKKEAKEEHKTRFRQEVSRVGLAAYLQLTLLGGLSRYVNNSKWASAFIALGTVIFAETSSRLWNKKPITFISKDKAAELYEVDPRIEREKKNNAQLPPVQTAANNIVQLGSTAPIMIEANNSIWSSIGKDIPSLSKVNNPAGIKFSGEKNKTKEKGLFCFETLGKAALGLVAAGFAITYARKFAPVEKSFKFVVDPFQNFYGMITKQKSSIKLKDAQEIVAELENLGFNRQAEFYKKNILNKKPYDGQFIELADQDVKYKALINLVINPVKFIIGTLKFPFKMFRLFFEVAAPSTKSFFLKEASKSKGGSFEDASRGILALKEKIIPQKAADGKIIKNKMSHDEFVEYMNSHMLSAFNGTSKSGVSNAELATLVKMMSSLATTWFLIADNYNMVMIKSKGENQEDATQKAKERAIQRVSALFYQLLLMDLFNSTFTVLYHSSLFGMSAVTAACTTLQELVTRKAIGMPILQHSRDEILKIEEDNHNKAGVIGMWYRFMTKLTGKKQLSEMQNNSAKA